MRSVGERTWPGFIMKKERDWWREGQVLLYRWEGKAWREPSRCMNGMGMRILINFAEAILSWQVRRGAKRRDGGIWKKRRTVYQSCQRKTSGRLEIRSIGRWGGLDLVNGIMRRLLSILTQC